MTTIGNLYIYNYRYHSPADFLAKRSNHMIGKLRPVKISYIEKNPKVYERNERVALFGEWIKEQTNYFMTLVFVGATNVGSIGLCFDPDLMTN